jgi:protein TonB
MNTQPSQNKPGRKSHKRDYRVAAIVAVGVLAAGYGIAHVIGGDATPRKRVMETVSLKLITPPPPPPKQEPPPPPPKMVEKQKIQPPMDKPEAPKPIEAPPAGPLALDAKGGAGSDAFGLGGKLGGADYAPGGGSPYGHFGSVAKYAIKRRLSEDEKLSHAKYSGTVKVWFTASGGVSRVEVQHSTGNAETDERIRQDISGMPATTETPPANMPAAIIRIDSQANET